MLWEGTRGGGIRQYDLRAMPFRATPYRHSFYGGILGEPGLSIPASERVVTQPRSSYEFRDTVDKQGTIWYNVGSSLVQHVDLNTKRVDQRAHPVR